MHDGLGEAQEFREERGPSASRGHKVHDLGDNCCRCVELAAKFRQLTHDPLMLGVGPIKECPSRARIEQQGSQVRELPSCNSRCQLSCHTAGPVGQRRERRDRRPSGLKQRLLGGGKRIQIEICRGWPHAS